MNKNQSLARIEREKRQRRAKRIRKSPKTATARTQFKAGLTAKVQRRTERRAELIHLAG